jgi:hypothetical protein
MQNLTVQKVCLALITLAFFVAAPWITSETLGGNSKPLLAIASVAVVLLFVYGLGERCWWIIPFCLSVDGNLNFLPLNFSLQELAIMVVFCYLLFRVIFGLDVAWKLGPPLLWIPLAGVLAVVLYHWISSGDIGIKMLGGTGWGGRRYFKVFIAVLCIPLLASFPGMKWQDLQKVPLVFFLGSFIDIIPEVLTTFIPAAAPLVWRVYSGVNLNEYGAALKGNFIGEQGITRIGALAKLGIALSLVTLCYFPARTWLRPERLWVLPVILLGGLLCGLSGFRNYILRYFLTVMTGLYATIRIKAFFVLPVMLAAGLAVGFTQETVINYPITLQRALSFLPGNWSFRAKHEAEGSSEWRRRIQELFFKEYFNQNPLLGKGYHFDPGLALTQTDIYLAVAKKQGQAGDEYADVRDFVEMRMPHEGPIHILLVTGVVGSCFFVLYCASLLIYGIGSLWKTRPKEVAPIQIWAVAIILTQVVSFFTVFGDLTNFLIAVCPPSILLYRSVRLKLAEQITPPEAEEFAAPETPAVWGSAAHPLQIRQPPAS